MGAVLGGGSAGQIGVAALSPTANNLIHEATKDDKTKITNILAHAVLGAIEAKASGTSATSGAVAAAGAEMIANTIAKAFYGVDGVNKTIDSLTNEEKENILTLSQLGSAVLGGVTGDSGYATAVSGEIGKRAVEYNYFVDGVSPMEERKQTIDMYAKTLFKGQANAEELATAYYDAMVLGEAKAFIEGLKGSVDAIVHLDETIATVSNLIQDPKGSFEKVAVSAEEWNKQLNLALETDPILAAEMLGYVTAAGKSLEMPTILLTGEALNTFQKVVNKNVELSANVVKKQLAKFEESISRGTTIKLGEDKYTYLGNGIFNGPKGGKVINTGEVDLVTGNSIYQRIDANNAVKSNFFMISADGSQINISRPDALKVTSEAFNSNIDKLYNRAYLRSATLNQIFADYQKLPNGSYQNTVTKEIIKGPIDIGHAYGWEHRRLSLAAKELNLTQAQFNDYVNARPDRFRLENMSENRSHRNEMPGKDGIFEIKQDMKKFMNGNK